MDKIIPIFFTFDNNYVEPAAVAFYSLLNKAKLGVFYEMYVLHSDISSEKQKLLEDIVNKKGNAKLTFINTNGFLSDLFENGSFNFKSEQSTFTVDTIIRCFGARFFPQYDKIIYSDVDIIVVDDISDLWETDMEDKYISGVKNPFMKWHLDWELAHLKPEHLEQLKDSYIAGGIWVMNLKKIREDNIEQKMIEVIEDETIIKKWNDQDIVNISCTPKIGFIPLNYISYPFFADLMRNNPDFVSHYTKEEIFDSIINPKIIHFAAFKPWNGSTNYSNLWWTIFDYLKLEKTSIFREKEEIINEKEVIIEKKYKKYKKLYNIFLCISILLLLLLLLLL